MRNMLRNILATILSILAISGLAQSQTSDYHINSIQLVDVDMLEDSGVNIHYTISFNSPLKIGDKVYCFITPVDTEGKPFPDGKGSFLTSGGLFDISQRGMMSLKIGVPASIIRRIVGTDEYHLMVNVMAEKDDEFILEDVYAFTYSKLKRAVESNAMQTSLGLLDLLFGGTDSDSDVSSGLFTVPKQKKCAKCEGTGKCWICHGDGSDCHGCNSTGECRKCSGNGYI